ncbi:hypothetical protein, partial [Paenibacillus graminis]|uniref:hypothetical protein n=1 Tax=Paenibacillus graminis TaxID=189425 RepID=UPI0030CA0E0B
MWIEDYIKLQFPFDPGEMRIEEAVQLKHENIPPALYRYRSFNDYSIRNLVNDQERLSYPIEFNDPYDTALQVNYDFLAKELFVQKNMKDMFNGLREGGVEISLEKENEIQNSANPFYSLAKLVAKFDKQLEGTEEEFAKTMTEFCLEQTKLLFSRFKDSIQTGYLVTCLSEVNDSILMWS